MKIKISNIDNEFKKLRSSQRAEAKAQSIVDVIALTTALKEATPIDTGLARASWRINLLKDNVEIINDVPYIEYLNNGSSKQAPAYFVEATALKYGKPLGVIVEVKAN